MKADFNQTRRAASQISQELSPFVTPQPTHPWQDGRWKRIWDRFVQYCLGNPEPRITLKRDRSGEHYWVVYDPISNQSTAFWSANEVRIWLEERYRR
jgi:hypothetical protein